MLSSVAELGAAIFSGVGSPPLKYFGPNKIKSMSVEENKQIKNKTKNPAKNQTKKRTTKQHKKTTTKKQKNSKRACTFSRSSPACESEK